MFNMHTEKNLEFKATFGVPLNKFMSPFTGFDIVGFDAFIKTPDGTSLKQHLIDAYSSYASELINSLLA